MLFLRKATILITIFLLSGCAAKRPGVALMPVPEAHTREALLLQYRPSGSPCLDALAVNLSSAGCPEVGTARLGDGMLLGCVKPQPGAQDIFSNYSFLVMTPDVNVTVPEGLHPYCVDAAGYIGYYPIDIATLLQQME